jgi:hypothetical protein
MSLVHRRILCETRVNFFVTLALAVRACMAFDGSVLDAPSIMLAWLLPLTHLTPNYSQYALAHIEVTSYCQN